MKKKLTVNQNCNGCGKCIAVCRNNVLQLINGHVHVINEKQCDNNGHCIAFCDQHALALVPKVKTYCVGDECFENESELYNWPVQILDVNVHNRYLHDSQLLIVADCSAYAYATFHRDFIRDHVVLIVCPQNDLHHQLLEKCTNLFKYVSFASVEVVAMTANCCQSLLPTIQKAMKQSGKQMVIKEYMISPDGEIYE